MKLLLLPFLISCFFFLKNENQQKNIVPSSFVPADSLGRQGTLARKAFRFKNKYYDIYIVDTRKNSIEVFLKDGSGENYDFKGIENQLKSKGEKLAMAMNGGMYMEDQNALGLLIQNGRQVRALNKKKDQYGNFYMQPNGVFGITADRQGFVVATEDYERQKNVKWATQSGPMIVHRGEINASFKAGSANLNIRNGVGVISPARVMFAISNERVNFYELAELFKSFGCAEALYLDGAISQMYLPETGRTWQQGEGLGPIIGVINQ